MAFTIKGDLRQAQAGVGGSKVKGILDYFPGTPRDAQAETLLEIEKAWDKTDVFVITSPTGSGKTFLAKALMNFLLAKKMFSVYMTPTNILLDQYLEHFPKTHYLKRKDMYKCAHGSIWDNCAEHHAAEGKHCSLCPYVQSVRKAHGVPQLACNVYTYLAHRIKKHALIFDEAHTLANIARDRAAKRLWQREYEYPSGISTYGQLLRWVETHPRKNTDTKLKLLYEELTTGAHKYLVEKALEDWHSRKDQLVLKLLPIDVSDKCDFLWGKFAQKIFLMSATIGPMDIKELGLDEKRVAYFDCRSPIPVDRRPLVYNPVASAGYRNQSVSIPILVKELADLIGRHPDKGFVHVPYSLAGAIQERLGDHPRLIFHDKDNKTEQYNLFYDSDPAEGKIMVGSGLYEGIDLKEDVARWQVILKVPYDSLAEPAMRWLATEQPKAYAWRTIRQLVQAYGRVSRGPTDYGVTYILDADFERLYRQNRELFPSFFLEAMVELPKTAPQPRKWRLPHEVS